MRALPHRRPRLPETLIIHVHYSALSAICSGALSSSTACRWLRTVRRSWAVKHAVRRQYWPFFFTRTSSDASNRHSVFFVPPQRSWSAQQRRRRVMRAGTADNAVHAGDRLNWAVKISRSPKVCRCSRRLRAAWQVTRYVQTHVPRLSCADVSAGGARA